MAHYTTQQAIALTSQHLQKVDKAAELNEMVGKWDRTGLLKGLKTHSKRIMSQLLESQAKQLIAESENSTGGGQTARAREEWNGIALPMIRRIYDSFAAKEFISVQPMNQSSGLVFYLDVKYGTAIGPSVTGHGDDSSPAGNRNLNSLFGVTDVNDTDPTGGFYGFGRGSYSSKHHTTDKLTTGSTLTPSRVIVQPATFADMNFDSKFSSSVWAGSGAKIVAIFVSASAFSEPDVNHVMSFMISSSARTVQFHGIKTSYPNFTTYNTNTKVIKFVVSASAVTGGWNTNSVSVVYTKQPATALTRGDFEARGTSLTANPEVDIEIPEIDIELTQETIVTKTKKLKAQWTYEFAQDLNNYQAIDAELELTQTMTTQVSMEIDAELLEMLYGASKTTDYWSARIGYNWNGSTLIPDAGISGNAYNQQSWFATLGTKFNKVSNTIHRKTMRGPANFAVVSADVASVLESIPGFVSDTDGMQRQFGMGIAKVGAMSHRWQIYKNPYLSTNTILMGYRGSTYLDTGAAYCPYIPLISTPLVLDPKNFTPRKGVMTRYGKIVLRGEFYGKVHVHGLDAI